MQDPALIGAARVSKRSRDTLTNFGNGVLTRVSHTPPTDVAQALVPAVSRLVYLLAVVTQCRRQASA
ncbi:hypothetical protein SBA4_1970013 [Candidatus Sulfopaludibacter sp. SbA4]|nr:hypothetical protein SBA4_1970013 [Candidatus Sulfopaludibacter sp. SbA4]